MKKLLYLLLITLATAPIQGLEEECIQSKKNKPTGYLINEKPPWGRLGNQLFLVSTLLAYAWDNNFKPLFCYFDKRINQLSYNRDRIFFRLEMSKDPIKTQKKYLYKELDFQPIPLFKNHQNVGLHGHFFSWKYFHHHYDELLAIFAPSQEILEKLHSKYGDVIAAPSTVAVHVRTYSKQYHQDGIIFVGLDFFKYAFEQYPKETQFVVFSDRIGWCKAQFEKLFPDKNFVYIEGNDHIDDLFLMSLMKHQIISNSTYSWWGAYLNQNPDKVVICPKKLLKNAAEWPTNDFYLPDWRICPEDFSNAPYPDDMGDYDGKTPDDTLNYF